ncbi:MAG: PHP domain-containing protein, partial [Ornithinimicrobium sp.]
MSLPLDLDTDWHTHTNLTDGTASPEEMVGAASARGLRRIHLTDHVRADTTWLPGYVAKIDRIRKSSPIEVV